MDHGATDLLIDIGNSRAKLALFQGERLLRTHTVASADVVAMEAFAREGLPARIGIGSVATPDQQLLDRMDRIGPVLHITGNTPSPLRSRYTTPNTLGVDRLANAVAAAARFSGRAVLAVDLGTCITYDLVLPDATYAGGAITPGVHMRMEAMHAYSARLPLVEAHPSPSPWGTSTVEALQAGVHHGVLGELRAFIAAAEHEANDPAVVLTGGDAPTFARACKRGIFAHPFLTLEGLRLILLHHYRLGDDAATSSGTGARSQG